MEPDSIPGQLDAIRQRLERSDQRMTRIEKAVEENTEITKDVRDALIAGRFLSRFAKWLAGLVVAGSALYAVWRGQIPPLPPHQ